MSIEETKPVETTTETTFVDPETTVFVGNVSKECTEDDLPENSDL